MSSLTLLLLTILSLQFRSQFALTSDGTFLLSFKYSILSDPLNLLRSWNFLDPTPCFWVGVNCSGDSRVVGLSLPNSLLLGSIPPELGLIDTLTKINLAGNILNGTLPATLFNASSLRELSLGSNLISGELPEFAGSLLGFVNLSDNALGGQIPVRFWGLFRNLTVLSLRGNYFSGNVPSGFGNGGSVEVVDLSANLFNGSLPSGLGGSGLRYLNFSYNKFSGEIPAGFAAGLPANVIIDVSFNNLTGRIPVANVMLGQHTASFYGNEGLCGKPLKNMCVVLSTLSKPPNVNATISPAIAVSPKWLNSTSNTNPNTDGGPSADSSSNRIKPGTIVGIILADLAGVLILGGVSFYLYRVRNKHNNPDTKTGNPNTNNEMGTKDGLMVQPNSSKEAVFQRMNTTCLMMKCLSCKKTNESATSDARTSSESEESDTGDDVAVLVMVDGETELEVEILLKASAYILGASGSSIVYKAVLQNGAIFAVRRLGETGVDRLKEFEGQVKTIAKLRHPNLVRVRGFYWSCDEKLVIYDYVSNGSLATSSYKMNGSTPYHLPLFVRLKIVKGIARGLVYIHEKRYVHGNIKPSNILLTPEMEPVISDFGLSWLVHGSKVGGSGHQFGSQRSHDGAHEMSVSGSPYISPFSYPNGCGSPYKAPESLKNLKPNPKWDVYSFGIVLLELLTGKVYLDKELGQWTPSNGVEDMYGVLRMADVGFRDEIHGKEEAMMSLFKLGFSCASLTPQKRPSMKEALQVLDKAPFYFIQ